uniref:Mitochondrial cytochrome c oxidase subunit Vb n=1 Tax=Scolopendra viridis TaxID=118503 RepID=A0A4D5RA10_SCOVI
MASLLVARNILMCGRRSLMVSSVRLKDEMMVDPVEHATGLEKREILAKLAGNDNPFDMRVYKRGPGTKDNPNLVSSVLPKRLIGCICEEDATCINWMWLHMGEPKRCECGYWFKLIEGKPL